MKLDGQITFLYADNLDLSARFYEDVLGLKLALDQGSCRIYQVIAGAAYVGVCQAVGAPSEGAGIILTLVTQDVDGWYERIKATGWECEHPPSRNESYDIYHFFLRDPDGYRIEIQCFSSADWDQLEEAISR